MVHGDDFVSVGRRVELRKIRELLQRRFEVKTKVIGSGGEGESRDGRILNRIIRTGEDGFELEPDQRHAVLIIRDLNLQDANSVSTPGEEMRRRGNEEDQETEDGELEPSEGRRFRQIVARANYLAADRVDIQFAVKELARQMSRPTIRAWKALKRPGMYLKRT